MRGLLLFALAALPVFAQPLTPELWKAARPIYEKTLSHPFLTGLADGSLPRDRFQFYLIQDSLYLRAYSQALNILASKAPHERWAATLSQHSIDAIEAERALHDRILAGYGVTTAMRASAIMAPSNRAYVNHLLVSVERLSFTEGLAAMLPCYWIYQEVGMHLKQRGSKDAAYQRWIDQYASAEYAATVKQVLAMLDESSLSAPPEQRESAVRLFVLSARYEYMFWDMSWRQERWLPE
jgi:thiaminase/transcriptional activator TenA